DRQTVIRSTVFARGHEFQHGGKTFFAREEYRFRPIPKKEAVPEKKEAPRPDPMSTAVCFLDRRTFAFAGVLALQDYLGLAGEPGADGPLSEALKMAASGRHHLVAGVQISADL